MRGNNRQQIFYSDEDCQFFKEVLQDAAKRNGLAIHARIFMTNHIHLLASPAPEESISKVSQSLGRHFVLYFNHTRERTGTLWRGRCRATIVEAETYLFACVTLNESGACRHGEESRRTYVVELLAQCRVTG